MHVAASVNTGLVEVFRSSDSCIVAPVARLYGLAVIRTHSQSRKPMKHDAPVLIHEPVPSAAAMIEHSVVRRERERAGANRHALAANGWRQRIRAYLGAAISDHADTRPHGRDR